MILTVLGVNGPYPDKLGACSGYLLSSDSGQTKLLLDCGSGALPRLLNETEPYDLAAAVLSHLHFDHMSDMLPLRYLLDFSPAQSLRVYCPETPARVRALLEGGKMDLYPMRDFVLGEMRVEFAPARHPVEAYCVRVWCDGALFVYTGDTNWTDDLPLFASGADLLLADAGLPLDCWTNQKPHMSAQMCGRLAREAGAKALLLTHLSPLYGAEALLEEARECFPGAALARAGMRVRA